MRKARNIEEKRSQTACCTIAPVPCIGGEHRSYRGIAQPFPAHSHEYYVVGLVTQGTRRLVWNDQPHLLEPGDLFVFNPGDVHSCQQQGDDLLAFESLTLSTDFAKGVRLEGPRIKSAQATALFCKVIGLLKAADRMTTQTEAHASEASPSSEADCDGNHAPALPKADCSESDTPALPKVQRLVGKEAIRESALALLSFLAETDSRGASAPPTSEAADSDSAHEPSGPAVTDGTSGPAAASSLDGPAERTFRHLAGNLANPSRLHQIAQRETLSDAALIRAYQRRYRITPMQHLASLRIERACKLLADGMEPAAVATETGFADQAHLTREFKRRTGLTPGSYRRQLTDAGSRGDDGASERRAANAGAQRAEGAGGGGTAERSAEGAKVAELARGVGQSCPRAGAASHSAPGASRIRKDDVS